jgi:perosamine synthetase
LKTAKDMVDQIVGQSLSPAVRVPFESLMALAKRLFVALKSRPGSRALAVEKTDATFDIQLVNLPMSRLSSMLYAHFDVPRIAAQRRANYAFLERELHALPGIRLLSDELPFGVCPWVFPIIFDELQDACGALREEGVPAVNWDGVRPADLSYGTFTDADYLYRNLVFLPAHQDLTDRDLQRIVDAVKRVLKTRISVRSVTEAPEGAAVLPADAHSAEGQRQGTNRS